MAQICHYVMVHTTTNQYMDATTPSKKQCGLKAGLCRFTDCESNAVMKELAQSHTLNYFCPCDPATLTCTNRHNTLTSLMFLTEKNTGKPKAHACANGSIPATATSSLRAPGALPLTCIFNQTFPI